MNVEHLSQVLPQYWPILLIVGSVMIFFGYHLVRSSLAAIGFLGGIYVGQKVWDVLSTSTNVSLPNVTSGNVSVTHLVVIFAVALIFAVLMVVFYKLAVFLAGFFAGGIIFSYFYTWLIGILNITITVGNNPKLINFAIFLVFGTIIGLVTLKNEKKAVSMTLGIFGSLIISYAMMIPLSPILKVEKDQIITELASGRNVVMLSVFLAMLLPLAVFSAWLNSKNSKKGS